jgi:S1-C subfamily serine protease
MADSSPSRGPARETRLLLLTLLVSVAVLFLLARFRFPERPITDLSPPQPLTRLGRPLAFDELSGALAELLRRFDASVVLLRVAGPVGAAGLSGHAESVSGDSPEASRLVPALRVRDDLALAPLSAGERVIGMGGMAGGGAVDASGAAAGTAVSGAAAIAAGPAAPPLVARDELRGLAAVRVPARVAPGLSLAPQSDPLDVPGYVAVLEASPGGPIIRAEFVSTVARADRPGWDAPAVLVGGVRHAQPGALLFSLGGRFIGMVLEDVGSAAVVAPGEALMARVDGLAKGESIRLAQPGFTVQPLSRALSKASGAAAGVVVSGIVSPAPASASASARMSASAGALVGRTRGQSDTPGLALDLGDTIIAAGGQPVRSIDDWQRLLARHAAGATLPLDVMRFGKPLRLTIALAARTAPDATPATHASTTAIPSGTTETPAPRLGATFRPATGGTLEIVSLDPAGAAALAGLQRGDRVTARLPARGPLTPARLAAVFAALKPGDALILALDRQHESRVVAVEKR